MRKTFIFVTALAVGTTVMLWAHSTTTPVLNQGTAGDRTVSGRAAPDSGPLRIYDISYTNRTSIGHGNTSMDSAGNFAISIKPSLVRGHQIIAVDRYDRSSAQMTVRDPDPAAGSSQ